MILWQSHKQCVHILVLQGLQYLLSDAVIKEQQFGQTSTMNLHWQCTQAKTAVLARTDPEKFTCIFSEQCGQIKAGIFMNSLI